MDARWTLLAALLTVPIACDPAGDEFLDGPDDAFGALGKADGGLTPEEVAGVLRVANEVSFDALDHDVPLDRRAASGIVEIRATAEFASLQQLDDVRYVGPVSLQRLVDYAHSMGLVVPLSSIDPGSRPLHGICTATEYTTSSLLGGIAIGEQEYRVQGTLQVSSEGARISAFETIAPIFEDVPLVRPPNVPVPLDSTGFGRVEQDLSVAINDTYACGDGGLLDPRCSDQYEVTVALRDPSDDQLGDAGSVSYFINHRISSRGEPRLRWLTSCDLEVGAAPATDVGRREVVALATGSRHACLLEATGEVSCWGSNAHGQLGRGHQQHEVGVQPVAGVTDVVHIVAGFEHTCARTGSGTLWCWGDNDWRQLGTLDDAEVSATPVEVWNPDAEPWTGLSAGGRRSCAIRGQRGYCWGRSPGTLSAGAGAPALVSTHGRFVELSVADGFTCGQDDRDGVSWTCWGRNVAGELGFTPSSPGRYYPFSETRAGFASGVQVSTRVGLHHGCALDDAHATLACWGGGSAFEEVGSMPTPVGVASQVVTADVGPNDTCWVRDGGAVECVGVERLGGGGVTNAVEVSVGRDFACALTDAHDVQCWGDNLAGQLARPGLRRSDLAVSIFD